MEKGRKRKDSDGENVEAYKHKTETRKNAVPVGLASYDTSKLKPKEYEYDPPLAPQFVWIGKKENTSFEVSTISLHIHKRIASKAIIRLIKKQNSQQEFTLIPEIKTCLIF